MRPLVTLFLLVFVMAVFFAAVGAAGIWGLRRQQVALAPARVQGPAIPDDADTDGLTGDAQFAAGRVPASPSPAGRDPFANKDDPARGDRLRPPPLPGAPGGGGGAGGIDRWPARHVIVPPPLPARPLPPPLPKPPPVPPPMGPFDLSALNAITHGREIRVEATTGGGYAVAEWRDPQAYVEWTIGPRAPGWYSVEFSFACADGGGGNFVVAVANQTLPGRARPTGGWGAYQTARLGNVHIPLDEETRLQFRPDGEFASVLMNVRGVRLVPAP